MSMLFRIMSVWSLIYCFTGCSPSGKNFDQKAGKSQTELVREYAFCKCLMYGFNNDSMKLQDASLAVYHELSDYDLMDFRGIKFDSTIKRFVDSIPKLQPADYKGKKAIIFQCMRFYKSKELRKLVKNNK